MKKHILLLITVLSITKLTLANCYSNRECIDRSGKSNAYCDTKIPGTSAVAYVGKCVVPE